MSVTKLAFIRRDSHKSVKWTNKWQRENLRRLGVVGYVRKSNQNMAEIKVETRVIQYPWAN